jgi:hypothetical protein
MSTDKTAGRTKARPLKLSRRTVRDLGAKSRGAKVQGAAAARMSSGGLCSLAVSCYVNLCR